MCFATVSSPAYIPFANVSAEIFALIAEFLDVRDIQASRLAGRDLYFLSSPYLFRSITFAYHQEALDRLRIISQDPLLSHRTHILHYDISLLRHSTVPDGSDALYTEEFPQHWSAHDGSWMPRNRLLHDSQSGGQCQDHYANLFDAVKEQDTILEHLEEHLQGVISAFPKLSTVILCNSYWKEPTSFKFALREDSISRQWIKRRQFLPLIIAINKTPNCNIYKIKVQGRIISGRYESLSNYNFGPDDHIPGSISYCLGSAFETACYPKEKIPFIYGSALSLSADEALMAQEVFNNLTHLELGICTSEAFEWWSIPPEEMPKKYWADFPSVLKSLMKVVDLSLDLKVRRPVDQQHYARFYHDDIMEIFGDFQMPRLKRLRLSQFRSCGSSVKDLLLNHPLLRDLSLNFIIEIEIGYDVWLHYIPFTPWEAHPDWVDCIEVMRRLHLQRLQLKGIEGFGHDPCRYGSENEDLTLSRIHDYILYGYGDNPLPARNPVELNGLEWDRELW